ncbi:MAG: hypothetical protein AAB943_00285 [Patescibacteria group bacterium]
MRHLFFVLLTPCFVPILALGQNNPVQVRLPFHIQILPNAKAETNNRFGLALWGILPDVNAPKSPFTTLLVGGLVWRQGRSWVEFMGGIRLNQNGYRDPILNIRALYNQIPNISVSAEVQQSFRVAKRRTVYSVAVDAPTGLWKLRAGVESENIHFFGKSNSLGLGPRVALPLPGKLPSHVKMLFAATYQIRNDNNFVRAYLVTNLLW